MSKQSIADKSAIIRNETQKYANTRGRVADVLDDINATKADNVDLEAEATARDQGDQTNADAIAAEATARAQGDQTNADAIAAEATARDQGDQTNADAIAAEAIARAQGDNLKLDKPLAPNNTNAFVVMGNGSTKPAGDLGKNFFNSDLSNNTARNHTMNAGVAVNTLGNPHILSGLPNKNTDIANFRKVRVQNTSGLDSVVDSKNLLTDGVTSMSDAEKDAWRVAQRKSNETYSTGQPRIDFILPKIIKNENFTQYLTLYGLNLLLDIGNCEVKLVNTTTNTEYLIPTIQTYANNPQMLTFGYNFSTLPIGTYRLKIRNGNLINIDTTIFSIVASIVELPVNLTWTFLNNTNTIGASDSVSSNSFGLINDADTGVQTIKSSTLISATDASENFMLTFNINTITDTYLSTKYVGLLNVATPLNSSTIIEFGYKNKDRYHYLFPTSARIGTGQDNYLKGNITFFIIKEGNLITMIENVGGDINTNTYQLLNNINYDLALLGYNSNGYFGNDILSVTNLKLYKL